MPRPSTILVWSAIAAAAAFGLWDQAIKDHVVPKRFHAVAQGKIYRSGQLTPATFEKVVKAHNIRTIIDLGAWKSGSRGDELARRTAMALGVKRYRFNLEGDATGNANDYAQALRLMTDPDLQPVLVHCGAGTERTGCTVILYREIYEKWKPDRAYAEADEVGHDPSRNPKLKQMLERWRDPIERALREGGPVEGAPPPVAPTVTPG